MITLISQVGHWEATVRVGGWGGFYGHGFGLCVWVMVFCFSTMQHG